jgi:hypothetical protein
MPTVPGTPDNVVGIHPAFRPTQADILQAAAIMHQQGKFRTAMDVSSGMRESTNIEDTRLSAGDYSEDDPHWKRWLATKAYATQPRKPLPELRGEVPLSQADIDKAR